MSILDELSEQEREFVRDYGERHNMTPEAVVRQALRQLNFIDHRSRNGETCTWSGDEERARQFMGPLYDKVRGGG